MPTDYPQPKGEPFRPKSNDFGILRSLDGHCGTNVNADPDEAADLCYRANIKDDSSSFVGKEDEY